ncbi:hypothetical protein SDRG_01380 [Saprolegnia diclina VS20]|uniref:Nucleoside phosphorylase domain-containing protein n=1 Tax=Saprolegnia diclina (strain VS20) TaxID=1156394 RepID=T0R375_SAPDV|nr:hypothetical protein SDRG_01380 [Saprolegnia diclina VS20]EQC41411.1 hypothetical protein SDRG_01380 [Saprolegnia diclina VS20]|eukprot:XP_008605125.1 hypothetical protein SDRG_01380 [Saprolegnia diclina VS20]
MAPQQTTTTYEEEPAEMTVGIIGGSSLFHSKRFSGMDQVTVPTEYGPVLAYKGRWGTSSTDIVFIQRHHADGDKPSEYKQPRNINYHAIVTALKELNCDCIIGVYSVGSMTTTIPIGSMAIPNDYFNPFDIINISSHYEAHIVPCISEPLRKYFLEVLRAEGLNPHDGGVYVQTAGPRFETKAEIRFFAQFGELVGMTGCHEAGLANELQVPFAMVSIVDNMAHGIGEQLTLEQFKIAQKANCATMERSVVKILDNISRTVLEEDLLGDDDDKAAAESC